MTELTQDRPSWVPEGPLCGHPQACRAWVGPSCTQALAPEGMSCSVSEWLPSGTCDQEGTCRIQNAPYFSWDWRPPRHASRLVGLTSRGNLLIAGQASPEDDRLDVPYTSCLLTDVSMQGNSPWPFRMNAGEAPCQPWLLHRRFVVGKRSVPEWNPWEGNRGPVQQVWSVLDLNGDTLPRDFDLDQLLTAQLAAAGATADPAPLQWVQGAPGQLVIVQPLAGGKVWLGGLLLEQRVFKWTRQLEGTLAGPAISDELGRLYVSLTASAEAPGRVVALSPEGADRWTQPGTARPLAVFQDTLFLDDKRVLSTEDGQSRYTGWGASPQSYVLLSQTHAATVTPCQGIAACTRVVLMKRDTGQVLASESLLGVAPWLGQEPSASLTTQGSVLLVQRVSQPSLTNPIFYPVESLRSHLVEAGQSPRVLGEVLLGGGHSIQSSLLWRSTWVGLNRDPFNNTPSPGMSFVGLRHEALSAPERGWLRPRGNLAGGYSPE
ncbi:hypothetical protein [Stigmatella aurantiaca]|uniref:hypothetical protein n=1 Tax=Stigmatella aurantiaca TaxID=41 RepID=UPI0009428160|nr:hypothetical protein [Stigmatella aurantiaca]